MSTPSTTIHVCADVPLNNRYDHTLRFATASEQQAYFSSKVARTFSNYTYVRRTWKLKLAATIDDARVWSYLYFKNGTSTKAKTYYYFINSVEYVNDSTVELSLELDVMQTYHFDYVLRQCYVEREHTASDNIGANTVDEGLALGELVSVNKEVYNLSSDLMIMTAATLDIANIETVDVGDGFVTIVEADSIDGRVYDRIFSALHITATPLTNYTAYARRLSALNNDGKVESIMAIWEYPRKLLTTEIEEEEAPVERVIGSRSDTFNVSRVPPTLNGYTPVNKKLLQYPYSFIYVTNNNGGSAVYKYEMFTGSPSFAITGNISPDAVVKMTPKNYKGIELNNDEAFSTGSFPMCPWLSDTYKLWLAQNQNQQQLTETVSIGQMVAGVAMLGASMIMAPASGGLSLGMAGAGVGMLTSGATTIAQQNAQQADMSVQPPQARGVATGSHNLSNGLLGFEVYHKTIDAYHARIIDDYFTMYGYACKRVKVPNIDSRPYFNYIKTVGSNIRASFCMEDIKLINDIYDRGITFWHNPQSIGDYSVNNVPT